MKLTFLGTGTSTGVPSLNCNCDTCRSTDTRDKRLRASALLDCGDTTILIDCGPDFYVQMVRERQVSHLDAALITHIHYDHAGGLDDLRPFCNDRDFPLYCELNVADAIKQKLPYCFAEQLYPGVPHFDIHLIKPYVKFNINGVEVCPLRIMHGKLPIVGYMFNDKLAYITDALVVPEETIRYLQGIDTLVINALRITEHGSHMNLSQALDVIKTIKPRRTFLTHLSHQMGLHALVEPTLPDNVKIAYDGLSIIV